VIEAPPSAGAVQLRLTEASCAVGVTPVGAAGTVAAVGPGVEGFKVGDAVSTIPSFSLNDYGLYGDLANAPVHAVTHHPASLSWAEAAAVWMQY
jgi:NADPH:quinone reductase-like Zn-dependent oxidoreductase